MKTAFETVFFLVILAQQAGGGDMSSIFPAVNQQFSKEIEDEANSLLPENL